jgi:predicted ATPase
MFDTYFTQCNHEAAEDFERNAMITKLAIAGYRSLRDVRLECEQLTVITGANGSGKSSLYRALRLLADIAQGRVIQSLATEGGLDSTLWAGPESFSRAMKAGDLPIQGTVRKESISLKLGFSSDDYGYAIDLGLPQSLKPPSMFFKDPEIKVECQWVGQTLSRSNVFAERHGAAVRIRSENGEWINATQTLATFDSMMTHCSDPRTALELLLMRERMRAWRFYDHLRTDSEAAARRPQVGTYSPVLSGDGANLAAAVQTIFEIGAVEDFEETIADAFDGASVIIQAQNGFFDLLMQQRGLLRPLKASELSDGTLRYLLLAAALLSPRPPELIILNEPENSLHPSLLPALARLIAKASERSQIIVVSHAEALVSELAEHKSVKLVRLRKELGETIIDDKPVFWTWPKR